jgi:hypothetical protein
MEAFLGFIGFFVLLCIAFPRWIGFFLWAAMALVFLAVFALALVFFGVFLPLFGIESFSTILVLAFAATLVFACLCFKSASAEEQQEAE